MLVTEAASTLTTRGVYAKDDARCHMPAYDTCFPEWGCSAETMWVEVAAKDYLAGAFVWTGFDYKGEPVPFKWPCVGSHFGIMDACGFPKDNYYYYLAWWGAAQVLHLLPHWTWTGREGEPIDVRCFSNCDEVELLLNGVSLGRKAMPRYRHLAWTVAYQPGELLARGYQGGLETARCVVETAGAPVALRLTPQLAVTASGDAIPVMAEVVDAQGRLVPTADNEVEFSVEGDGRVLGVGNGDPSSHEPDKATRRRAFNGLAQAIVRGRGAIVAASPGLASVRCRIGSPP